MLCLFLVVMFSGHLYIRTGSAASLVMVSKLRSVVCRMFAIRTHVVSAPVAATSMGLFGDFLRYWRSGSGCGGVHSSEMVAMPVRGSGAVVGIDPLAKGCSLVLVSLQDSSEAISLQASQPPL